MTAQLPDLGIGIDIGGTSTKAAVVDAAGAVLSSIVVPTERGADGVVATATAAMQAVAQQAGIAADAAAVIGVGIPGTVDPSAGTVRHAVNVGIGADPVDLAARLGAAAGRPVHVENDVRAAALGADWFVRVSSPELRDLAYLSVGTGIGAGYVRSGSLHRGDSMVAGEIGHIPIDPNGPLCVCGQTGCIEAIAAGAAIERAWPTPDGSAAQALHAASASGDPQAVELWRGVMGGLSRAVLVLALAWDPQVIVLSGGVAALGEALHEAVAARLAADGRQSEFLSSLDLGARLRVVDPAVPLGPVGAVRAAHAAPADQLAAPASAP